MRKHFLLLLLMTLLPLAGWAEDYEVDVTPANKSLTWNNKAPNDDGMFQGSWIRVKNGNTTITNADVKAAIAGILDVQIVGDGNGKDVGDYTYKLKLADNNVESVGVGGDTYYVFLDNSTATLTIDQCTDNVDVSWAGENFFVGDDLAYTGVAQAMLGSEPVAFFNLNGVTEGIELQYALSATPAETEIFDSYDAVTATNANTDGYKVYVKAKSTTNYTGGAWVVCNEYSKEIAKADINFANIIAPADLSYSGDNQALLALVEDENPVLNVGIDALQYKVYTGDVPEAWTAYSTETGLAAIAAKDLGAYTVKLNVPASDNWNEGNEEYHVIIARALIDEAKVAAALANPDETFTFNYAAHTPALTVSYDNDELTVDDGDIAIAYADNIDAGNATATVTFNNYYLGDDPNVAYTQVVEFTIAPKSLGVDGVAADGITTFLQPGASAWTYNGVERSYTSTTTKVRYTVGDTPHNLDRNNDYTRTPVGDFTNATESVAEADKPYYLFTGKGNFTGTVKLSVSIAKADLTATVKSQNIAYGDDVPANAIDESTINGIQGEDDFATVVGEITYIYKQGDETVETPSTRGEYSIEATATADNYNVTFTSGTLTIGNATAYIVPVAKSKLYGAADPTLAWKVVDADNNELGNDVLNGTVTLARQDGEDVGSYIIYVVSYTAGTGDNYTVANTMGESGTKTAPFTIFANTENTLVLKFKDDLDDAKKTKVYDGTTDVAFTADDFEAVSGLLNGDAWETIGAGATIAAELSSADVADGITANATITVPNYPTVEVQAPLAFTITPLPITITANDQIIAQGGALDQSEYVVSDDVTAYGDTNDDLNIVLTATETAVGVWEDAIEVSAENANYDFAFVAGKLTINGAAILEMSSDYTDADADWYQTIKDYNGQEVTVKITVNRTYTLPGTSTTYTWKGEDWNAFILPFDITPKQLSEAFGYAIVNVVNPAATKDGNIAFKLQMSGTISANTPFMLKNYEAVAPGTVIDFGAKTIVAPTNAEVSVDAGENINFIGSYNTKTIGQNMSNLYFYNGEGAWKHLKAATTTSWNIAPFNAYMEMPATGGAREYTFTFEELDGGTTAIRSISEDATGTNAKGWYNLNGMKMDGAPVQKGVYIKDGKKVVIK